MGKDKIYLRFLRIYLRFLQNGLSTCPRHGAPSSPRTWLISTSNAPLAVQRLYLGPVEAAHRGQQLPYQHPQGQGRARAHSSATQTVGQPRRKSWRRAPVAGGASRQERSQDEMGTEPRSWRIDASRSLGKRICSQRPSGSGGRRIFTSLQRLWRCDISMSSSR